MTIIVYTFFFVVSELRWKVIVCFVDIGAIDDHYCLNFLCCVQWVKMRGDCLLCWYWWNWWPLLFKLFFFVFSELRWEVIVCFVDIDGIDDHYWLNSLFCVQCVKMRGIVCFVDIGGIDDYYCLNFLFCAQWVKMRGDCFVDIGGINDHYCLNFLFIIVLTFIVNIKNMF